MVLLLWRVNMGKRMEIDLSKIIDERTRKLVSLAIKHDISPTSMAHFIGVSYATYNRYQQGRTVPQSENTKAVIDNIIKKLK
jgi:DNA-binding XRE family transcriptional regulator